MKEIQTSLQFTFYGHFKFSLRAQHDRYLTTFALKFFVSIKILPEITFYLTVPNVPHSGKACIFFHVTERTVPSHQMPATLEVHQAESFLRARATGPTLRQKTCDRSLRRDGNGSIIELKPKLVPSQKWAPLIEDCARVRNNRGCRADKHTLKPTRQRFAQQTTQLLAIVT